MKVNVQIRKASFGKGYDLFLNGLYEGYFVTLEEASEEGTWRARKLLGLGERVIKEFDVGDDE